MKNPKEYLNHFGIVGMEVLLSEMIKEVQKDSYNEAITDACELAMFYGDLIAIPGDKITELIKD